MMVLTAMPRDVRSRFVVVDGIRTHYLEAGDGFPVVLLHSGEISDRRGNARLAFGGFSRSGTARENQDAGQNRKEEIENRGRRGGSLRSLRGRDPFSVFHFLFSRVCSG